MRNCQILNIFKQETTSDVYNRGTKEMIIDLLNNNDVTVHPVKDA